MTIPEIQGDLEHGKCTLYYMGDMSFGYSKIEVKQAKVTRCRWAQYPGAVRLEMLKQRARRWQGFVQGYRPTLVIVDGWNHIDPPSAFHVRADGSKVTRFSMCAPEWSPEFDTHLAAYIAASGAKILRDYRGVDTHARLFSAEAESVISRLEVELRSAAQARTSDTFHLAMDGQGYGSPRLAVFAEHCGDRTSLASLTFPGIRRANRWSDAATALYAAGVKAGLYPPTEAAGE